MRYNILKFAVSYTLSIGGATVALSQQFNTWPTYIHFLNFWFPHRLSIFIAEKKQLLPLQ